MAIVDDEQRVLESLESLLDSAGFAVLSYTSGLPLLEPGMLSQIDCLVSDIGMAVMDGRELKRRVQLARPDLPVILITGREDGFSEEARLSLPYQDFFRKPFAPHALLAAVHSAIHARAH